MSREREHLTKQISQLREAIKRKYRMFKQGTFETEQSLEKQYRPLLKELRDKKEFKVEPESEDEDFLPGITSSPNTTVVPDEVSSASDGQQSATEYIYEKFEHPTTRKYMLELIKHAGNTRSKIDHSYGPHYEGSTLKIGDKQLKFDEDGGILVGDKPYGNSEGLYELIFMRIPDDVLYSQKDLQTYKSILTEANAHRRGYKADGLINRNNSLKYTNIIRKLFPGKTVKGKGIFTVSDTGYVHWDDPNELCDRLRLLVSSAEVGNTGHKREIINITEELREAGFIKGGGNRRFKSLLQ